MSKETVLVWFRSDLRLGDHGALAAAACDGRDVVPLFVWSSEEEREWAPGAASRWWLHESLGALDASLRSLGSSLVIRRGDVLEVLRQLARESGATGVFWNRRYEPSAVARDRRVREALEAEGIAVRTFSSSLLLEPWENTKRDGSPYRVFTPFWNAMRQRPMPEPLAPPERIRAPAVWPRSDRPGDLALQPVPDWAGGLRRAWSPGEAGAEARLSAFLDLGLADYPSHRDHPARSGTSRLSPHLHFGEIGPRTLWRAVADAAATRADAAFDAACESWLRQLGWREFAHHLLFHFPHTTTEPLRAEFARLERACDDGQLELWQRGRTGYPIVDAGMRELWETGWMHNRVRMIVASFLVKDLRLPWQSGARWFQDTLVDADLANNTLGWQWTAGCGADAAPYFRVFNPTLQSRRFDPDGAYLRRWLPELAGLDSKWIHEPHAAPQAVLERAGIRIGRTYPEPVVAHDRARRLALEAYEALVAEQEPGALSRPRPDRR